MTTLVEEADREEPEGVHAMAVLDRTGDTRIEWNPRRAEEVQVAEDSFRRLVEKGYTAYRVGRGDRRGEVVREFDPNAEKLILAPAMQGG